MTEPVTEAIRRALNSGLLAHDQAVLVGISGGPDSTALLLALAEAGIPVIAAHLNHRVRGAEADRDEDWVRALTAERGLPLVVERLDLTLSAGGNLEARARRERYAFLGRAARMVGARAIAVGHTADDQIETLLIRLVRGTGPAGLGGMAPSTRLDRLTGGGGARRSAAPRGSADVHHRLLSGARD
ncbi:MAG: hypothetical protein KatS3mg060_0862 [Dehalococcoidia bacterium]|nr:MAG: hypothetical protein KatS3mg060_0862 [Dehalococcoidia bacterium]